MHSNIELLALAASCSLQDADRLLSRHNGSLFALFHGDQHSGLFTVEEARAHYPAGEPVQRLHAARELLCRSLTENMAVRPYLSTPGAVRDFLRHRIGGLEYEVFYALFLDPQNCLIDASEMFRGTLTQTSVYPREVVKCALAKNAAGVVFAHNHPSGATEPSRADQSLTNQLKQALALVDVRVLDHFVVGSSNITSFAESGLL